MPTINKPKAKRNTYNRVQRQKYYQLKEWKMLSDYYRMEHPLCQECLKNGITKQSEHTHHIVSPFKSSLSENERMSLLLDPSNLMALCAECHSKIHLLQEKQKKLKKSCFFSK